MIASDYIEAVQSLEKSYLGKLSSIARETNLRAPEFSSVLFVHENRRSNVEAHVLANCILCYRSPCLALDFPDYYCIPIMINQ
jgi:hypothetical protein